MQQKHLISITIITFFLCIKAYSQNFITTWSIPANSTTLTFNALTAGTVNYSITYTFGGLPVTTNGSFNTPSPGPVTITFGSSFIATTRTLSISPANLRRFYLDSNTPDRTKLEDVTSFGTVPWSSMESMFYRCTNLNISTTTLPNLSNVTNMKYMFSNCQSLTGPANIGNWNTANVTNMSGMFSGAGAFNQNIGNWTLHPNVFLEGMLNNSGMDCTNYTATLIGWKNNNPTVTGRTLDATGRMYGINAVAARNHLINTQGWNIAGDSPSGTFCGICTLSATASATPTTCGQSNGTAIANPSGGTAPYSYAWSNGGITQVISGLAAGSYTVTVTSWEGCTVSGTTNVSGSAGITADITVTHESCGGCHNGTATALASGGSGYTYYWSNGATTQTISGLAPGIYTVTITDTDGCTAITEATVSPFGCGTIQVTMQKTEETCAGSCNGTATATVSGGTAPYSYIWSNGATTQMISGLCTGTYSVTTTDVDGCPASGTITLSSGTSVTATVTAVHTTCGQDNGSVTAATMAPRPQMQAAVQHRR